MNDFAKALRKNQTPTESMLWHKLRDRQLLGLKFRRQRPITGYIVDFYCPEKQLIIEIDGEIHYVEDHPVRDKKRQMALEAQGLTMLRFTTQDILENMDGVLEAITLKCL